MLWIILIVLLIIIARGVKIVPQARAIVIERTIFNLTNCALFGITRIWTTK